MGEVIDLAARRAASCAAQLAATRPLPRRVFYYDLSCPLSYLDGDRVDRFLGDAEWRPAPAPHAGASAAVEAHAEQRAELQRLPLSWPELWGTGDQPLHRAAAYAAQAGVGAGFAMAALRLVFSGGFELSDDVVLEEAAAATGLSLDACCRAAADPSWDRAIAADRAELIRSGLDRAPAVRVGEQWFAGDDAIVDAGRAVFAPRAQQLGTSAAS
jgi:2-hydroxychromene-2-carboxylate isomerase